MVNDDKLKWTFDEVPDLYEKARPLYPQDLFTELVKQTGIIRDSNIVEIGPGTGQATRSLAKTGAHITAIELGPRLAGVARNELADYKNVAVITGAFEDWQPISTDVDLVFAATAFHWIDPEVRFIKSHQLLKKHGYLAVVHTNHVSDMHGDAVYQASQPIYNKYYKGHQKESSLPDPSSIRPLLMDQKLFEGVGFWTYPLEISYNAREYAELFATFSSTIALPELDRNEFLNDLERMVNSEFDGLVTKHFIMSMTIGAAL